MAAPCLLLLFAFARAASAEPFQTIVSNGDPQNRVDIAILGDGYTAAEADKYASDVQQFVQRMFNEEPLKEYQRFFNVHRVDVFSAESGADHPEASPPVFKSTAFDAAYNCSGIQRLICASVSKVTNAAANSLSPAQRDVIILLVNDTAYGGSGGAIVTASTNALVVDLVLHEFGHTFGLLADEYSSSPPACVNSVEPPEPNVTRETERSAIKWKHWIDPSTPVPTAGTTPALPGLYVGAKYCTQGLFRPTYNSRMRDLTLPYEQVNSEQLVKRIYNRVSPIDSVEPAAASLTLTPDQGQSFSVVSPSPLTHALAVTWSVDGQQQSTSGPLLTIGPGALGVGAHTVEALVRDPTAMVRNDPEQLLSESRRWDVTVSSRIDGTDFFVRQHYADFLNRAPDDSGLNFWTQGIESCGADAQCREAKRVDTSAAFFLSIEFQETGYLVYRMYKAAFGNLPNKPVPVTRASFLPDTRSIGSGVVVGQGDWRTQLEANKQAFALAFVQRAAFQSAYPQAMTAEQFVNQLDANAGGVLTEAVKAQLVSTLGSTPNDVNKRASVLRQVAENAALQKSELNRAFVLMEYFGYLQRDPDAAPEPTLDFAGYNFWLSKLDQFGGNYVQAEMVRAFINSTEYRSRFGQ